MYGLICKNQKAIIALIDREKGVPEYESLVSRIAQAQNPEYQDEYKNFWAMKTAQLGGKFDQAYFTALNPTKPIPAVRNLCEMLYQFPRLRGDQALQFSFATKLRHMLNRELPIYDNRVASFYLFQPPPVLWCKSAPSTKLRLEQRINGLIVFHNFLINEYKRLRRGLLANPIAAFKQQLQPTSIHTDVKIIDWLLYGFVRLADKGQITW
jgi:hypothetical protein